jgi:NAD(P)-dependent dehydrogenase (short-subunit alcohol dehydrogenase family)
MIYNEAMAEWSAEHPSLGPSQQPLLAVPPVEPEVISDAMVYLCGRTGRHVTGVALPVDGGQIIS